MDKRIEDYLHLYLGCEVEWGFEARKKIGRLAGKDERYGWQIFDPSNAIVSYHPCRTDLLKIILRPLSDMTDEHINELWDTVGYNPEYESPAYPGMTKRKFLKRVFEENGNEQRIEIKFENAAIIQNFLRKKGYDCDGLIPAGLAIDKTKMNTNG
mgnify:FL=1